jgi:hypothetical protein
LDSSCDQKDKQQDGEANPKTPTGVWQSEFTKLRVPNIHDLRADPFERGANSGRKTTGFRSDLAFSIGVEYFATSL